MTQERAPLSEADLVLALILDVDDRMASDGHPRIAGQRRGDCGNATTDLAKRGLELGLHIPRVSVTSVHRLFGAKEWEVGRLDRAFGHYFNVSDTGLLIDLTFCQFIDPQTEEIRQHFGHSSGVLNQSPVAQALLRDGHVALTDENLRDYLRITSAATDKDYIARATVAELSARGFS